VDKKRKYEHMGGEINPMCQSRKTRTLKNAEVRTHCKILTFRGESYRAGGFGGSNSEARVLTMCPGERGVN